MPNRPTRRTRSAPLLTAALLAVACADPGDAPVAPVQFDSHPELAGLLTIHPQSATLVDGASRSFAAFDCPRDASGFPDAGPDGVPGTSDDLCTPADAGWSATTGIGSVSPATGTSTVLTAALPSGATSASGLVIAGADGQTAAASVLVQRSTPLTFVDESGMARVLRLYAPEPNVEARVLGFQMRIRAIAEQFERDGLDDAARETLERILMRAKEGIRETTRDARRVRVVGPDLGRGDVRGSLESVDALGDPIRTYPIDLMPGTDARVGSKEIIATLAESRIRDGTFGDLVFVKGVEEGMLIAAADGYRPARVRVIR